MPRKVSGEFRQLNADYMADFAEVARLVGNGSKAALPLVRHNGDGPAWVDLGNDAAVGIIMPMRGEPAEFYLPTWTGIADAAVPFERTAAA